MRYINNTDRPAIFNSLEYLELSEIRCAYLVNIALWLELNNKDDRITGILFDELFTGFYLTTLAIGVYIFPIDASKNFKSLHVWYGTVDDRIRGGYSMYFDSFEELIESIKDDERFK